MSTKSPPFIYINGLSKPKEELVSKSKYDFILEKLINPNHPLYFSISLFSTASSNVYMSSYSYKCLIISLALPSTWALTGKYIFSITLLPSISRITSAIVLNAVYSSLPSSLSLLLTGLNVLLLIK